MNDKNILVELETMGHYGNKIIRVNQEELDLLKTIEKKCGDNLGCDEWVKGLWDDPEREVNIKHSFNYYC